MTISVKYSAEVDLPVAEVFAVVTDLPRLGEWAGSEVRHISPGPVGVGATFQVLTEFMGASQKIDYRVSVFEPGKRFGFQSGGSTANDVVLTFQPTPEGTKITYEFTAKVPALLSSVVKGPVARRVEESLTSLVVMLEGAET